MDAAFPQNDKDAEIARLKAALDRAEQRIAELEALAFEDPLLGVANRRAFLEALTRALAATARYQTPASLVFIDVDALKSINDGFGHAEGDAALKRIASIISARIRKADMLARVGGDELAVILSNATEAEAVAKAEALAASVAADSCGAPLSISCGVVALQDFHDAETALSAADAQMYLWRRARR
jgi:diguanylate cyclase (GGDEF)-like protein